MTDFKELFRFSRAESIALTALLVLLCVAAGIRFYQRSSQPVPVRLYFDTDFRDPPPANRGASGGSAAAPGATATQNLDINVNTAPAESLLLLPGIGPVMSARIIAYRDSVGAFDSIESLIDVPGIGPKTLEAIRELVRVK